jgi:Domain of unknown function (DUF1905)
MAEHRFSFRAEVWEHDSPGAWHFLSLPEDAADEIDELTHGTTRGFGSVRVEVTIGATTWRTSIFPDSKRRTYVLPLKRQVRTAEHLDVGSRPEVVVRPLLDQ